MPGCPTEPKVVLSQMHKITLRCTDTACTSLPPEPKVVQPRVEQRRGGAAVYAALECRRNQVLAPPAVLH